MDKKTQLTLKFLFDIAEASGEHIDLDSYESFMKFDKLYDIGNMAIELCDRKRIQLVSKHKSRRLTLSLYGRTNMSYTLLTDNYTRRGTCNIGDIDVLYELDDALKVGI